MDRTDKDHLEFIYNKLHVVHGELLGWDYMIALREIIDSTPTDQQSLSGGILVNEESSLSAICNLVVGLMELRSKRGIVDDNDKASGLFGQLLKAYSVNHLGIESKIMDETAEPKGHFRRHDDIINCLKDQGRA